jgi:predicted PurR-regulated permease PerM
MRLRSVRGPLYLIAACCAVAALHFGRDLLIPLAAAVLLSLLFAGTVEALRRVHIPRALSALVLLLALAAALGATLEAIAVPAQQWLANAPRSLATIEQRIRPAQSALRRLENLARRAASLAGSPERSPAAAPAMTALDVATRTGWVAGEIGMSMALALLLLAAGPERLAPMTAALVPAWRAAHVRRAMDAVRVEVGRYYGTLALINIGFGIAVGATMWLLGMPNPMLWGVLAGVLNFVPYLGCATTFAILTLVSLVVSDTFSHTLLVGAAFLLLAGIEGHLAEPILLGRRLALNPIVILVALWFGGWLWGIAGVVFTLPTLLAVKAVASHGAAGGALVRFLGPQRL